MAGLEKRFFDRQSRFEGALMQVRGDWLEGAVVQGRTVAGGMEQAAWEPGGLLPSQGGGGRIPRVLHPRADPQHTCHRGVTGVVASQGCERGSATQLDT